VRSIKTKNVYSQSQQLFQIVQTFVYYKAKVLSSGPPQNVEVKIKAFR
jgi:hypothetical protein